jgi:hypothetical protein
MIRMRAQEHRCFLLLKPAASPIQASGREEAPLSLELVSEYDEMHWMNIQPSASTGRCAYRPGIYSSMPRKPPFFRIIPFSSVLWGSMC